MTCAGVRSEVGPELASLATGSRYNEIFEMTRYFTLIILGFSGPVFASWPAYEEIDANHDGKVDAAEAERVAGLDFLTADKNQDGVLTRVEYAMAADAPAPPSLVVE